MFQREQVLRLRCVWVDHCLDRTGDEVENAKVAVSLLQEHSPLDRDEEIEVDTRLKRCSDGLKQLLTVSTTEIGPALGRVPCRCVKQRRSGKHMHQ